MRLSLVPRERRFFVRENSLEIHVDPPQLRGEIQAVGPGVETGGEVEDRIGSLFGDQPHDDLVHHCGAGDHRPRPAAALRHGRENLVASRSG